MSLVLSCDCIRFKIMEKKQQPKNDIFHNMNLIQPRTQAPITEKRLHFSSIYRD